MPRPVGLVASRHLGIAKSLRWFAELPIGDVLSRTGTRARHRHNRIDIPAVLDCADAINDFSGLIEFKR